MPKYIQIAVNIPGISGVFDYHLTAEQEGQVQTGSLVVVPFGSQRVQGIVLNEITEPSVPETRPVEAVLDPIPVVTKAQIDLARQMADDNLGSLADMIELMLPPGLSQHADTLYSVADDLRIAELNFSPLQRKIVEQLLQRGPLRGRQLDSAFPRVGWKAAAQELSRRGILDTKPVLPTPSVRPKIIRTAQLSCPPAEAEASLDKVSRQGSAAFARRQAIIRFLIEEPWPVDVTWVYAVSGGNAADLERLAEMGLIQLSEAEAIRDPLQKIEVVLQEPPELTIDQMSVWEEVKSAISRLPGQIVPPILLHGVTGSGKTEIYLQAVAETLRQGRQAVVLVPEIALTPQTVRRFLARFPGRVGLIHSKLSPGERFDTWRRIRSGKLPLVVGPRSALFAPFNDLGLIVIDECHDPSYHQADTQPFYNSIAAALAYGKISNSLVMLGSATPGIEQMFRAQHSGWKILTLPVRVLAHRRAVQAQLESIGREKELPAEAEAASLPLPPVEIVDMRQELKAGNRSMFSRELESALRNCLHSQEQAILFLNRLGSATFVFCRDCGEAVVCPRCSIPLTYHAGRGGLICHRCNYQRQMPTRCSHCGSNQIRQYGAGTERVEQEVLKLIPEARTLRWDSESTRNKGAHEILMAHFSQHHGDILIGTQMLAKGLDLPRVTLVGVILADVGLTLPDYRANERTFQLLTQVAGRAGRSPLGGKVIFQTFRPQDYAIQAAANHDYTGFYQQEITNRKKINYPPFNRLVRLEYRHLNEEQAKIAAEKMLQYLQLWITEGGFRATEIIGPAPCYFARVNSIYRWQIILKGPDPVNVLRGRKLGDWRVEVDPASLL